MPPIDHLPTPAVSPEFADPRIAEALVDAIAGWAVWCHRRVDSVHPLEGERGRVRHSMDCSPPPDPWLAYLPEERGMANVDAVQGQVVVPLAVVQKQPMRELNAADREGRPIPLLGMAENIQLAVAMLKRVLSREGIDVPAELEMLLKRVAGAARAGDASPTNVAEALIASGAWDGQTYWDPEALSPGAADLLRDFAAGFLLAGLLPANDVGVRQVIKFSFHWRIEPIDGPLASLWRRAQVSLRAGSRVIELPMTAPSDTRSYHMEFQTPPELDCIRLDLPADGAQWQPGVMDTSGQPVAHVHGRYQMPPDGIARAHLVVPRRGLWTYAMLATTITVITMWLVLLLPGAMTTLRQSGEGAAAILLALPAVLIGFAARRRESALAAWMLSPLRGLMLTCSLILFTLGWALVGELREPWNSALWISAAILATILLLSIAVVGPWLGRQRHDAEVGSGIPDSLEGHDGVAHE